MTSSRITLKVSIVLMVAVVLATVGFHFKFWDKAIINGQPKYATEVEETFAAFDQQCSNQVVGKRRQIEHYRQLCQPTATLRVGEKKRDRKWYEANVPVNDTGPWVLSSCHAVYYLDLPLAVAYSNLFGRSHVVELGAGCGCYTAALLSMGQVESVAAFDGVTNICELTDGLVSTLDLSRNITAVVPVHDWTLCMEVGEHVPAEYESAFLDNVVAGVRTGIVLSWAVPGQGGHSHLNERSNEYVRQKLLSRGFIYDENSTFQLRASATKKLYKGSVMVYRRISPQSIQDAPSAPEHFLTNHSRVLPDIASAKLSANSSGHCISKVAGQLQHVAHYSKLCLPTAVLRPGELKRDRKWYEANVPVNDTGAWVLSDCHAVYYLDLPLAKAYSKLFGRSHVVEFGAGCGCYTAALLSMGQVQIVSAFDGVSNICELTNGLVSTLDISRDVINAKPDHDWTLCMEVGEHIPAQYEDVFLDNVVAGARVGVLLSWAVPGKGGHSHVNEQSNEYIRRKMRSRGFVYDENNTIQVRTAATKKLYKNSVMVFRRSVGDNANLV